MDLPRRVFKTFLDLLNDGGLVLDDEERGGIENRFSFLRTLIERFEVENAATFFNEHLLLERLNNVVTNADLGDFKHVVASTFCGQHDHRDRFERWIGLELGQHLDAVHHGHRNVEKDEVRSFFGGGGKAFDTIGGFEDVAVEGLEGLLYNDSDGFGIVDGENFIAHGGGGLEGY